MKPTERIFLIALGMFMLATYAGAGFCLWRGSLGFAALFALIGHGGVALLIAFGCACRGGSGHRGG
ncbi:hypothetical protein LG047_12715 [Methylocystis sp. WRRC1]|uniref:hypothetical protein n=1 Tax=unclassified Methylocystis TaxID=2625913 RepID=UPI0001F8684A|nr:MULTISPECIES: hypothetical protein [unclassified Methylocystis]MCC3246172.1 hypothetical protein [Methylocystis sp. WRRC1]